MLSSSVDVFEHLEAPTELLRALSRRLVPGGILVVCTGNGDARAVRRDPANHWYLRWVVHFTMVTHDHARFPERALGMRLVRWQEASTTRSICVPTPQRLAAFVFEVFHRGRAPWLRPLLRHLPKVARAEGWETRPQFSLTRDHAIVVWRRA